jgi:hypothetical protein
VHRDHLDLCGGEGQADVHQGGAGLLGGLGEREDDHALAAAAAHVADEPVPGVRDVCEVDAHDGWGGGCGRRDQDEGLFGAEPEDVVGQCDGLGAEAEVVRLLRHGEPPSLPESGGLLMR